MWWWWWWYICIYIYHCCIEEQILEPDSPPPALTDHEEDDDQPLEADQEAAQLESVQRLLQQDTNIPAAVADGVLSYLRARFGAREVE